MLKKFGALAFGATLLAASASASAATVTVFTDKAAWEAAAGAYVNENFTDTILKAGLTIAHNAPEWAISNGVMKDRFVFASNLATTFNFSNAMKAFGGNFDLTINGAGSGIAINLGGGNIVSFALPKEVPNNLGANKFFGFVSDLSFNSVTFRAGTQVTGSAETYSVDNVVFGQGIANAPASDVPEPGSIALVLAGLGLIGANARRKKNK